MSFDSVTHPRILLVGCLNPHNITIDFNAYLDEFESLVRANTITVFQLYRVKLREINPSTFLTKGKLEELRVFCLENSIEEVIFSEKLTPHQEMKLEKVLGITVYDRTHLILEIFEKQAKTDEAKIQVKIAFLQHKKTRLAGRGSHFSQQGGQRGIISGAGETQKELDLQHINHLLERLKRELKGIENSFSEQRKERIKNNVFSISLVGYTNAGKSTLFNALTKANVVAQDKLFATLDTTTRRWFISHDVRQQVVLSDTVGFVQNLPHELVASFRSTLSEINYSSLIFHVVDVSNKNWRLHKEIVLKTLRSILVKEVTIVTLYNKIDLLNEEAQAELRNEVSEEDYDSIFISAIDKETLRPCIEEVKKRLFDKKIK
jgi:GTP-binding protein HflX